MLCFFLFFALNYPFFALNYLISASYFLKTALLLANQNREIFCMYIISNGNRTEWSPIRSVIIRVITKSDDRAAGVRFVYQEYDYRQNWTTRSLVTN